MKEFNEIYELNKKLDAKFVSECNTPEEEMTRKNILELLVELGEFANETRCFKYWSCKGPSPKNIVLEEYSDCLMLTLYFCNVLDVDLDSEFPNSENLETVDLFIYLYNQVSLLKENMTKTQIKKILSNLICLGHQLGFTNQDIIDAYYKKNDKDLERFKTNFSY